MTSVTGAPEMPRDGMDGLGFSRRELLVVSAVVAGLVLFGYADLRERFDAAHGVWREGAEGAYVWMFAILRALPILWCRRHPLIGFTATLAASALAGAALASVVGAPLPWSVWPWSPSSQLCLLAALVVAGLEVGRRRTIELATAYFLTTMFLEAVRPGYGFALSIGSVVGGSALAVGGLELLRDRRDTRHALAVQEERTEAERTRRTLLEERARIGRELHDVVAHHMSLIAVQAETAPFRITGQSPETEAEFRSISAVTREALNDMRKILGLLRADSVEAETAPQPRLADVPALVEDAGAALEASGDLDDVPPLIGVTAYRVVQESLSNARRHAGGAEVSVRISRTEDEVRIEVRNGSPAGDRAQIVGPVAGSEPDPENDESDTDTDTEADTEAEVEVESDAESEIDQDTEAQVDDGQAHHAPADDEQALHTPDIVPAIGQGMGITGMRERVLLVHGEIETGPTANGGFAVTAVLPLERRP